LNCKIRLRKDVPEDVVGFLKKTLVDGDIGIYKEIFNNKDVPPPGLDHPFFKCQRWFMLFLSKNWDDNLGGGKFFKDGDYWVIDLDTEFKNYDNEIKKFIDWVSPFVVGRKKKQYVGWYRGEDGQNRINIYIER
jgi:hypothetical protein